MLNISPLSAGMVRVTVTSLRRVPRGNGSVLQEINNHVYIKLNQNITLLDENNILKNEIYTIMR